MLLSLSIMDDLSKGQPVSSTYLELWCRTFDESFVTLSKPARWPSTLVSTVSERSGRGAAASGLRQDKYNALLERMSEIGDTSMSPPAAPAAAPVVPPPSNWRECRSEQEG